jgi:hypothetical protein
MNLATPFVYRYYHFTVPYMSDPVNAFTVVANTMEIVSMIGCYKVRLFVIEKY